MRGIIHLIFILCGGVLFSSTASALTTHDCTLTKPVLINYGSQSSVVVNTTSQTQVFNVQISCPIVLAVAAPGSIGITYTKSTTTSGSRALLTNG
ncbi:MAG: spore coat U domain-containing protein, partial [Hafnia sp.]